MQIVFTVKLKNITSQSNLKGEQSTMSEKQMASHTAEYTESFDTIIIKL